MSDERVRDAHFQHAERALESVLSVPAEEPRALSWVPRKEVLLLALRSGRVLAVEPSFGTRTVFDGPAEPVHLANWGDGVAVLAADGRLVLRDASGSVIDIDTGLRGESGLRVCEQQIAVIGEAAEGRRVRLYTGASFDREVSVPDGAALGCRDGAPVLAKSVAEGLSVMPLGSPLPPGPSTNHTLRFAPGGWVVGVVEGGATVWKDGQPQTIRLLDTAAAALCHDGRTLALGTRGGLVALADVFAPPALRGRPARVEAHGAAVTAISFSTRGRWLATVGDNCRLWAYRTGAKTATAGTDSPPRR
ncbi:MAG: hypothetical protein EXR71_00255 [Myxococcales bacterium]|nr:hypothetical protein [Myxococcales bacterium]